MEFAIHACKSHIRHLIEFFQRHHHPVADFTAGDFPVKIPLQTLAHIVDHPVDILRVDRAFIAGIFYASAEFIGIEIFPFAVALYHFEFTLDNAFVSAETVGASQTFPAAAHAEPLFDHP